MKKVLWLAAIVGMAVVLASDISSVDRSTRVLGVQVTPPPDVRQFDVRNYGAKGDGVTDDSLAIQKANNAANANGGGAVVFGPGTYIGAGIVQYSNVQFYGTPDTVLKHPNGVTPNAIITSRKISTTGSIDAGSNVVHVASAYGFKPGAIVAIRGAGGSSTVQSTTLTQAVTADAGAFTLQQRGGFPIQTFLRVDDEIIAYNGISAAGLAHVARGLLGTKAAPHVAGAKVGQLRYQYATVASVAGTDVALGQPATVSVSGTTVYVGATNIGVSGLVLDANATATTSISQVIGIDYALARWGTVSSCVIKGGARGGVALELATSDSVVEGTTFIDDGAPQRRTGAAVWLFQGAHDNVVRGNTFSGGYIAVEVDDRTMTSTEWDSVPNANTIQNNAIDIASMDFNVGIYLTGASRNVISDNALTNVQTGIAVENSSQGTAPSGASANQVTTNTLSGHKTCLRVTGSSNVFSGNSLSRCGTAYVDKGKNNSYIKG